MRAANYGVQKTSLALKQRMDWLNANYGGKQIIETEHAPCNFDIITCKSLDDLHQATMEGKGKKKASKNTVNFASSKNNDEDCVDLFRELEIKNLVDESETPKSSGQKRSYSLSSVSSLSVKKNSSISELKSAICALEADVVEVKKTVNDDRRLFYDDKLIFMEDKISQLENFYKSVFKQLTSRMIDVEATNDQLKSENVK